MAAFMPSLGWIVASFAPFDSSEKEVIPPSLHVEGQDIEKRAAVGIDDANEPRGWFLKEWSDADPFEYEPIPKEHAFTVKVSYRYIGEHEPMPYLED